jgi:hypothetical protein
MVARWQRYVALSYFYLLLVQLYWFLGKTLPSSFHVPSPTPPPALAALHPRPHLPRIAVGAVRTAATESSDSAFTRPPPRGAAGWGLAVEGVLLAGEGGERRKLVDEERDGGGWGCRGGVVVDIRGGACTGTRWSKTRVKVPHARVEVTGTRATGELRGERPCGHFM